MISTISSVILLVLFLICIFLVVKQPSDAERRRRRFINELEQFLVANKEIIRGSTFQNYKLSFDFEGVKFVFEDIEEKSLKGSFNSAYLRVKLPKDLDLMFIGKKESVNIRKDVFLASEMDADDYSTRKKLKSPSELIEFDINSLTPSDISLFLSKRKVLKVLFKLKEKDERGQWFIPLKIVRGEVVITFGPSREMQSSYYRLQANLYQIENYLEYLLILEKEAKKIFCR